jgi:hypothetical protein
MTAVPPRQGRAEGRNEAILFFAENFPQKLYG